MFPILKHLLKGAQMQNSDYAVGSDEVFWETCNKHFLEGERRCDIRVLLQVPLGLISAQCHWVLGPSTGDLITKHPALPLDPPPSQSATLVLLMPLPSGIPYFLQ